MLYDCRFCHHSHPNYYDVLSSVTRGFRDQNAGPDPGWLVAAGCSKKKMDIINFFAPRGPFEH